MLRRVHKSEVMVRSGAVSAELAITSAFVLLPLLLIAVDFAVYFHHKIAITNCARKGARWAADPVMQEEASYHANVMAAARSEAPGLTPPPTVTLATGNDAAGHPYVEVTVSYGYRTILLGEQTMTSRVRMRRVPKYPD